MNRHPLVASRFLMTAMALVAAASVVAGRGLQAPTMSIVDVKPGMEGTGRTVFSGADIEDFHVTVLGVLANVMGPMRNLIVARLSGGPLATTGVIQGMSGSPVYIDGKLVGAVSYSLGTFPKEPIAGITPIDEMTRDAGAPGARPRQTDRTSLSWSPTPAGVFDALRTIRERASAPFGAAPSSLAIGPASVAAFAPELRPIGAAMVFGGFDPSVDDSLRAALDPGAAYRQTGTAVPPASTAALQPGDPVGVSLIRGDLEMGATGTVTAIDGTRVYAFGHPFLNLGTTSLAMTRAKVIAVLPSLDSSLKIASLGPVVGALDEDRESGIGGTIGAGPHELVVHVSLVSGHAPARAFTFYVAEDPTLTPLFAYVGVLNALASFERQVGVLSIEATGSVSFGRDGQVTIDDMASGDGALAAISTAATAAINVAAANEFQHLVPDRLDLTLRTSETPRLATIDRAWLDTTRPHPGGTYHLQVLLHNYRGDTEVQTIPVNIPADATGTLTLTACDAPTLVGLNLRELNPARPASAADLMTQLNDTPRNDRLYVRLTTAAPGAIVPGRSMADLPTSVQSVLDADKSGATQPLARAVIGAWDVKLDKVVRGMRELTITLTPGH